MTIGWLFIVLGHKTVTALVLTFVGYNSVVGIRISRNDPKLLFTKIIALVGALNRHTFFTDTTVSFLNFRTFPCNA